jgi:hypothetical protein
MKRFPSRKLARCPYSLGRRGDLFLDHSHYLVRAPATLAALPSTRAIPDRDVFCVADPHAPFLLRSWDPQSDTFR